MARTIKPISTELLLLQSIVFVLLALLHLGETIVLLALILLEAAIALTWARGMDGRWSVLLWQFQIFTVIFSRAVIDYEDTFMVSDPELGAVLFAAFILVVAEALVAVYLALGENAVRPILAIVSSITIISVLLMIGFVANEGIQTFEDVDPISFITGKRWQPFYEDPQLYEENVTVFQNDYSFTFVGENGTLHPLGSSFVRENVTVRNDGVHDDSYELSVTKAENLTVEIQEGLIEVPSGGRGNFTFTVLPETQKQAVLELSLRSINSDMNRTLTYRIDPGSDVVLEIEDEDLYAFGGYELWKPFPLTITNLKNSSSDYYMTIDAGDNFAPYIKDVGWDFTNRTALISLEAYETRELRMVLNQMVQDVGTYGVRVTATDANDSASSHTLELDYTYKLGDILTSQDEALYVNSSGFAQTRMFIDGYTGENVELSIQCDEPDCSIYVIMDGTRYEASEVNNLTLSSDGNGHFTLQVAFSEDGDKQANVTVGAGRAELEPQYGILPFIYGTLITTVISVALAVPIGVGCAIYIAEFCPRRIHFTLRSMFDLLAGIPSVIYGLWGFLVFSPFMGENIYPMFDVATGSGRNILSASLILSIMILPIIISLSEDSIRSVSKDLKEGSIALGVTPWHTIRGMTLKAASSGIIASVVLATGRAIGETMAVLMISGATPHMPDTLFQPMGTMTSMIASTFGWSFDMERTRHAVFAVALLLFLLVFLISTISIVLQRRMDGSKRRGSILHPGRILTPIGKGASDRVHDISDIRARFKSSRRFLWGEKAARFTLIATSAIVISMLLLIIVDIVSNGGSNLSLDLFTDRERDAGRQGGFKNAIIGSVGLTVIAIAIALPMTLAAAIYIQEYCRRDNPYSRILVFASDILAGTPSIVFGAFGFMFFVFYLGYGYSMFAGAMTLTVMVIPLLLRSSIEALKVVPKEYREGSMALGASKWETIKKIVIPAAKPFIISGTVIAVGRAIGETAAVMLTAGYSLLVIESIMDPTANMPNLIYTYYETSIQFPTLQAKVYTAAFVLLAIVLVMNLTAKMFKNERLMKALGERLRR